jgi:hypothetical protein
LRFNWRKQDFSYFTKLCPNEKCQADFSPLDVVPIDKRLKIFTMQRDEGPVMVQVKSGLLIAVKMLAAFTIAATFLLGSTLVRDDVALG